MTSKQKLKLMRNKFGTDGRKWFLMQKMLHFCNDHRGGGNVKGKKNGLCYNFNMLKI